ncbi:MAG: hypothetical protein AAGB51_09730 [Planctomycetota bacterium]
MSQESIGVQMTTGIGAACVDCDFDLQGLDAAAPCPECGSSIAYASQPNMLAAAPPEFLKSLGSGLSYILNGILLYVGFVIGSAVFGLLYGMQNALDPESQLPLAATIVVSLVSYGLLGMIGVGVYRFTKPEPGTPIPDGSIPRATARFGGIAFIAANIFSGLAGLGVDPSDPNGLGVWYLVSFGLGLMALVALAVTFFGQVLYVRRLAPRVSNRRIYKLAKQRLWQVPLLSTVGIVLLGLGPLIALVLYWNLLHYLRKDIKAITKRFGTTPASTN